MSFARSLAAVVLGVGLVVPVACMVAQATPGIDLGRTIAMSDTSWVVAFLFGFSVAASWVFRDDSPSQAGVILRGVLFGGLSAFFALQACGIAVAYREGDTTSVDSYVLDKISNSERFGKEHYFVGCSEYAAFLTAQKKLYLCIRNRGSTTSNFPEVALAAHVPVTLICRTNVLGTYVASIRKRAP